MPNLLKEFKRSLRNGTGKAYCILEKHPELPVDELLVEAAFHNTEYDRQCCESHVFQVTELLKLRPNYQELILRIAERFALESCLDCWEKANQQYWDIEQLYDLLSRNRVSPRITEVIHDCFVHSHHMWPGEGHEAIMKTEGIAGLLLIARTVGSSLRNRSDFEFDDWLTWTIRELYEPDHDWHKILANEAAVDPDIRAFLTAFEDTEREEEEKKRNEPPYSPVDFKKVQEFLAQKNDFFFSRIKLKKSEQAELRRMFMRERNPIRLKIICQALLKSNGVTSTMIPRLAELSHSRDSSLARRAILTLSSLKNERIRKIAIREMAENPDGWKFFELLERNWQPGDETPALKWFNRLRDSYARHSMIMSFRAVEDAPVPLLRHLLDRTNCGLCRESLAEKLAERGALDDGLCREFLHDSMENIRKIGEQHQR